MPVVCRLGLASEGTCRRLEGRQRARLECLLPLLPVPLPAVWRPLSKAPALTGVRNTSPPVFLFIIIYFIEVQLIDSVVLTSAVQPSDSVVHRYTFSFAFFSMMAYHRILNIVPCAVQQDLNVYPPYIFLSLIPTNLQVSGLS